MSGEIVAAEGRKDKAEDNKKVDMAIWRQITVGPDGGVSPSDMAMLHQFAIVMSAAGTAVPAHLRGEARVGLCMSVAAMAIRTKSDPFLLAQKTYVVNDKLAFESQVIHALIEQSGYMARRLRDRLIGEGDNLQCEITGWIKGEEEPFVYLSPKIKDIATKNSPLWKSKPSLQLFYNASRDWARKYLPEVMIGIYSNDELEDAAPKAAYVAAPRTAREAMERATVVVQAKPSPPEPAAPVSPAYAAWRAGLLATTTPEEAEMYQIPLTLTEAEFDAAADEKAQVVRARRGQ